MNKIFHFFFLLPFLVCKSGMGQTYTYESPFVLVKDTNDFDLTLTKGIEITNTGTTNLDFNWESVLKDTLADSHFEVCNSGNCMGYMPSSGIMPTIVPGAKGWIKLHVSTGISTGTNTIKYILKRLGNVDTLTFKIIVKINTSLSSNSITNQSLSLYPNPVSEKLFLKHNIEGDFTTEIIDHAGTLVLSKSMQADFSGDPTSVDLNQLKNGLYFIKISSNNGIFSQKLLISH